MTDRAYHRGKWEDRKFRYKFLLRCVLHPLTTRQYFRALCELDEFERLLEASPTLPAKMQRPYLHRGGCIRERARAVLDHYHHVQGLPEDVRRLVCVYRESLLAVCEGRSGEQLTVTCSPCGFDREGELMLILRFNGTVITRISFAFIRYQGKRTLFIAGLQGAARGKGPEVIRRATKACHGLFPRRLLCEAVSVIAEICAVESVVAVSEHNHVLRQLRYFWRKRGRFVARYSECWASVGGVPADGFWHLPAVLPRKAAEHIPARKRAEYRKRNGLLDHVRQEIKHRAGMV